MSTPVTNSGTHSVIGCVAASGAERSTPRLHASPPPSKRIVRRLLVNDWKIRLPGPDLSLVLLGQNTGDLSEVAQIVDHPRRQKLL